MVGGLALLILLTTAAVIQTVKVPQQIPLTVAEVGGNVTLSCPVSETDEKIFHWYKQPLGYMVQTVATGIFSELKLSEQFKDRFKISEGASEYILTIRNVSKEDEATYFCQSGAAYSQSFTAGSYLVVNDRSGKKLINVRQTPEIVRIQTGDTVTSECSLSSASEETTDPCPDEIRVYWFRDGLESHPSFIYSHKNNSDAQERRSCVYRLSRTIKDSSLRHRDLLLRCGRLWRDSDWSRNKSENSAKRQRGHHYTEFAAGLLCDCYSYPYCLHKAKSLQRDG